MNVDRPRARPRRLLRDRRRQHRGRHRRRAVGQAPGPRRRRVLRRRRDQPGLLPRVPELRRGLELPVVFVCENNLYGEFTPMAAVTAGGDIAARARRRSASRPSVVDGNDLRAVRDSGRRGRRARPRAAAARRCSSATPTATSATPKSDPATYRPEGELEHWQPRDPLLVARERLLDAASPRRRSTAPRRSPRESTAPSRRRSPPPYPDAVDERADGVTRHERRRSSSATPSARRSPRSSSATSASSSSARTSPLAGGVFKVTRGPVRALRPDRVFDTPISELALAGAAFGAAVTGLRPVFEIMFGDFMALPMDSLVNQSAKFCYISNEQATVPLVVRSRRRRRRALRRDPLADPRDLVPGRPRAQDRLPVHARPTPRACSRRRSATTTRSIFLEHKRLYSVKGERRPPDDACRSARRTSRARART